MALFAGVYDISAMLFKMCIRRNGVLFDTVENLTIISQVSISNLCTKIDGYMALMLPQDVIEEKVNLYNTQLMILENA